MTREIRAGIALSCIGTIMLIDSDVPLPHLLSGGVIKAIIFAGSLLLWLRRKKKRRALAKGG